VGSLTAGIATFGRAQTVQSIRRERSSRLRREFHNLAQTLVLDSRLELTWVLPTGTISGLGFARRLSGGGCNRLKAPQVFRQIWYDLWHAAARAHTFGKRRWRRPVRGLPNTIFELAGSLVPAAPKEKNMKRTISLWLGLLGLALLPALAQTPAPTGPTGKIHGHVINPTGASQTGGTVSLVSGSGAGTGAQADKFNFPVDANGDYTGQAAPGTYSVIYRTAGMTPDKQADKFDNVKIINGQDVVQDIDMSRQAYIDALPADQKKQLEDLRKHNSEAMKANEVIKNLNGDLRIVTQDIKDADAAHATALSTLGDKASKADIDAKEAEIKTAKYTEIQTLMLKDTAAKPDASVLWAQLGQAQSGLKQYDAAAATFKKTLDLEAASKKPNPSIQGLANSGLGEIYARTSKVPEATAAYDAAAKINPTQAAFYLKNEAVIFFQTNQGDAQVAAATEAIAADPTQPLVYYLKGQGLIQKATVDAKTQRIILPPGCAEAYQKYLDLAPTGPYAAEVKGILDQASQKVSTTFKATKK
jgi:tetratricopeptide (TPR) repeat protein